MKSYSKLICFLTVISFILSLCACSDDGVEINQVEKNETADVIVFKYTDEESSESAEIKSGLYAFILSQMKTECLYYYSQYYENASTQYTLNDNEAFWNTVYGDDGRTFKQIAESDIQNYCKRLVVAKALCKKYGISVTKNEETKAEIEAAVQNHINAYGDETTLNSYLYRYGITSEDVFEYYEMKYFNQALENYLFGVGGKLAIDSNLVEEKFEENWVKVKNVFISFTDPEIDVVEDENQKESSETSTENAKEGFTFDGDRTKEKVVSLGKELFEKVQNGEEEFDNLYVLSEDNMAEECPDGYIIQKGVAYETIDKAIFEMEEGETRFIEGNTGVYIIQKQSFSSSDIDDYYEKIEQSIIDVEYLDFFENYNAYVEINSEELSKYDIISADCYEWQ